MKKDIENNEVMQAVLDSLDTGVIFIDSENRITHVNKAAEKIRKISRDEKLGASILNCHPDKIHKRVDSVIRGFKQGDTESRHVLVRTEGRYFDNNYSIVRDKDNNYLGVVMESQDITDKIKLEKELKRTNQLLERKVKERTSEIKKAYDNLKIAQNQLIQSEKMAAIGNFISGIAHEINNPLDGIQNCIHAVLDDINDDEGRKKYLDLALEGLYKIEMLVQQLLGYARQKNTDTSAVDINDLINDILSIINIKIKNKNIELTTGLSAGDMRISCEQHSFEQVLINIIINAIESMPEGGELTVVTGRGKSIIFIKISDTGSGIPEEIIDKIYDPFFTTKTSSGGTGLGLYISYDIVKRHKGKIEVETEADRGTTFTIILPAYDAEPVETEKSKDEMVI